MFRTRFPATPGSPVPPADPAAAPAPGTGTGTAVQETAVQETLWDAPETGRGVADRSLADVTFVVFDLETTGGAPADAGITEFGAVKVRGGEVLGEFQTLVHPGTAIPPFIAVLTGITDAMVAGAPPLESVVPAFLEFCRGAVLVAHNAPYDIGFLRAACAKTGRPWPRPVVVDTVALARHLVTPDEARNRKLGTLAQLFGSSTTPNHRALQDARATVDVLHALIGRVGSLGVTTLGELRAFSSRVPESSRRKRHLADGLPNGPGVYVFHDEAGRVLYVGTSVDIRTRVRSYFTASEQRTRMAEMVARATGVRPIPCATTLEARVRELRLIAEHAPPYNRRSRHPERAPWLKLTAEPFPRLAVVRDVRPDGAHYLGPFSSAGQADLAAGALQEAFPIRRCTPRLPRRPRAGATACLLADIGRCGAPCVGGIGVAEYAEVVEEVRRAITERADEVVAAALRRAARLAEQQRFEEAGTHRDRLLAFVRGAARGQRLAPLAGISELMAACRREGGGWELVLVRYGRLAGTSVSPPGADPRPYIAALSETGEMVEPRPWPLPAAHPEETELILTWLERPGVRLVHIDGEWALPVSGGAAVRHRLGPEVLRPSGLTVPGELPEPRRRRGRRGSAGRSRTPAAGVATGMPAGAPAGGSGGAVDGPPGTAPDRLTVPAAGRDEGDPPAGRALLVIDPLGAGRP